MVLQTDERTKAMRAELIQIRMEQKNIRDNADKLKNEVAEGRALKGSQSKVTDDNPIGNYDQDSERWKT